jgi:hypothetical protein
MKKETRVVKATERKSNHTRNERASKVRGNKEYISMSRRFMCHTSLAKLSCLSSKKAAINWSEVNRSSTCVQSHCNNYSARAMRE